MQENQAVVLYGCSTTLEPEDDPPAFMGTNDEPVRWHKVNAKSSIFLLVMLHWQAAFGGAMPYGRSAKVKPALKRVLDRTWSFMGEVNRMRAYYKNGNALCFLKWEPDWVVFVGAQSDESLAVIAEELHLQWASN
jgi:hypothetical protein